MASYEICFLAADGQMAIYYLSNFAGDDHARSLAAQYLQPRMKVAEVWQGGSLISLVTRREGARSAGMNSGVHEN